MLNTVRISIALSILVILASSVSMGQNSKESILVDEFGSYPCDGFRGRIDILLSELQRNPGWDGIVINMGRGEDEIWAVMREEMIRNHITFRGFDASRITYSRQPADEFKTQFFRVPSSHPEQSDFSKNYVLASVTTPVVLEDYDFDDLCPPLNDLQLFATLLEQNQAARATILVRGRTLREARKKEKEVSHYLIDERKIAPSRLKLFLTEKPDFDYGMDPVAEYRFIP